MAQSGRLMFSPDRQLHEDLTTIARLTGEPVSKVLGRAVGLVGPLCHEMASSLRRIEAVQLEAEQESTRFVGEYQRKLDPYIAGVLHAASEAKSMSLRLEGARPVTKRAKRSISGVDPRIKRAAQAVVSGSE